jgi:DNA-binding PadR family transcriptional regulator
MITMCYLGFRNHREVKMFWIAKVKEARLLAILTAAQDPLSGSEIIAAARAQYGFFHGLWTGSLYPLLHRLEKAERVSSQWRNYEFPRTKEYFIP